MKVEILTLEMSVDVRGPKAQVEALTSENLRVLVDFTGAQPGDGASTYKAIVQVDTGRFKDVGAVRTYTVSASVTPVS